MESVVPLSAVFKMRVRQRLTADRGFTRTHRPAEEATDRRRCGQGVVIISFASGADDEVDTRLLCLLSSTTLLEELVTMKPAGVQDAGIDLKLLSRFVRSKRKADVEEGEEAAEAEANDRKKAAQFCCHRYSSCLLNNC